MSRARPSRAPRRASSYAAALAALCVACAATRAPIPAPTAVATTAPEPSRAAASVTAASEPAPEAPPAREPVALPSASRPTRCPVPFAHQGALLARVGDEELTGCDLLLALDAATRRGAPLEASPRAALEALVREALFAREAERLGWHREPGVQRQVREALAAAALRDEARAAARDAAPTEAAIERYYRSHRDEFARPARVHLRAVELASEAEARAVLRRALAGEPFEQLARERSVAREARRDEGDLGLVPREGNDRVPAAAARAGFALERFGEVAPEPVYARSEEHVGRGRRARVRVVERWWVVQRLELLEAHERPLDEALREELRRRLARRAYDAVREGAAAALRERLAREARVNLDVRALRRLRVPAR